MRSSTDIRTRIAAWEIKTKFEMRPRSRSRERVVVDSSEFTSGEALDPMKLLVGIAENLKTLDLGLEVKLTDGEKRVSYPLSVFCSRQYEVVNGEVKFGFKRLKLGSLKASIEYNITVVDDSNDDNSSINTIDTTDTQESTE